MARDDLVLQKVRSKNLEQIEYAHRQLLDEVMRLDETVSGWIEIKIPMLKGACGTVATTVHRRQPDP